MSATPALPMPDAPPLGERIGRRALDLGVPFSLHIDLTWRCNERCIHCYLDHDDKGELTTAEVLSVLDQAADAGSLFLTLSGGEPMLRADFWEIMEHARARQFSVKLKSNALLIDDAAAQRLRALDIEGVQISVYSHRAEVHDRITKVGSSFERTIAAIRRLKSHGLNVAIANVLMRGNQNDEAGVHALANSMDCTYTLDPTITPHIESVQRGGDFSLLKLRIPTHELAASMREPELVGNVDDFCLPPVAPDGDVMESVPCSAGHTLMYVSPYGDVFPCVQFPLPTGNVRTQRLADIWYHSEQMNDVRSIRLKDLSTCSSCSHVGGCTRCPGLAYMEGNMRGASSADCEKSFARTGVWSANMVEKFSHAALVQIQPSPAR